MSALSNVGIFVFNGVQNTARGENERQLREFEIPVCLSVCHDSKDRAEFLLLLRGVLVYG